MKNILILSILFIFSNLCFAEETKICFKNISQFEQHKSKLPEAIQKMPLHYTGSVYMGLGMAAIKIEYDLEKNKFLFTAAIRENTAFSFPEKHAKEICLENEKITITLENGSKPDIKFITYVKNETTLAIKNDKDPTKEKISLALSTKDAYSKMFKKIEDANPNKDEQSKASSTFKIEKQTAAGVQ